MPAILLPQLNESLTVNLNVCYIFARGSEPHGI